MYSVFIGIQYAGILVLLIELLYICRQKPSRIQNMLMLVVIATLINFVGYLFELQAVNKEMALMAVKVIYLGKPYIILGVVLFVLYYFDIKFPKPLVYLLCSIHITITLLVLTCEKQKLFYSSIDFVREGYFPHLVLGHGIIYMIYTGLILLYLILILYICTRKYRSVNSKKEKKQIILLSMITVTSITGLVVYLLGITKGYDSTLPAYLICTILLLVTMLRYDLLDTMSLVKENVMDEFADGLLVFDKADKLIYANSVAKCIFPDLSEEKAVEIVNSLKELAGKKEKLHLSDMIYQISKKEIEKQKKYLGTMYVITDITESYNYTILLEEQRTIADEANRAKSDFLAKMSHEIRTPINGIIGMNEMILRESGAGEIRQHALDVKSSAYSLLSTVNDILDFSKIESGKMELVLAEYEVASMLNDVINTISVKAGEKKLEFIVEVSPSIPSVLYGDELRIRQVLMNLLSNAVKYTQKGSVTLRVGEQAVREEVILQFEVEDTGRGIKEEDLPKLFAEFERIEEDKNHHVEGTGLGMSITKQLLKLMDGDIRVESVYGEGSRFFFDLAQDVVDGQPIGDFQKKLAEASKEYVYSESFHAPDAKVLIVDDNEMNRKIFVNLLKETKIQVTDVESGKECLDVIQKQRYDIIFLDHMMPEMDGEETLQRMHELENNLCAETPVVMLTANAVVGAREHYIEIGFDDFLSKPILPDKLEKMIQRLLPEELLHNVDEESL